MTDRSSTVDALLTLLGDEDAEIVREAEKQLLEMGSQALPLLKADLNNQSELVRERLEEILRQLEPRRLHGTFRSLPVDPETGDPRLEDALLSFTRIGFPDFNPDVVRERLDHLAGEVTAEINRWETIDDHTTVRIIREKILDQHGFESSSEAEKNPNLNFLNWVLERKTATPLTLCCLIRLLCERLDLPLKIVGLPAHTILRFQGHDQDIFFDPNYSGRLLTREDCREFIEGAGYDFVAEYLWPISTRMVLLRLFDNLIDAYQRNGNSGRIKEIRSFRAIVERRY